MTHLVELGRRRTACIGDNPHRGTATLRLQGYRTALAAAGMPVVPELVAPAVKYHRRDGAEAKQNTASGGSGRASTVPTLTTVDPDKGAIAERAVERIADRIAGTSPDEAQEIVTPFRLEVRESTACA